MAETFPTAQDLRAGQLAALNALLGRIIPANPFVTRKLLEANAPISYPSLEAFRQAFPFTTKQELVADQIRHPPFGRNLTYPVHAYSRFHQTSGTTGKPLPWLDTPETWSALIDCWGEVYRAAGVTRQDTVFFAFSFGPFLGFWLAFDAAARLGCLCIPGGGLSSLGRLELLRDAKATVLCCTPSYALHLGELAVTEKVDLSQAAIRKIILAGEAGGSLPATRGAIEKAWPGAHAFDHHGMTETGPVTYECPARPGRLHVIDRAFLAEVIDPASGAPADAGELVLTTLLRDGSPLLRYRTGDRVRLSTPFLQGAACECGRADTALDGGILGRTDDMVIIRGVNIFPSAVEQVVRGFPEIVEYQVHISHRGALAEMHLTIEPARGVRPVADLVVRVEKALHAAFALRIPVTAAVSGSLPRTELKARRWKIA